jgi:hypothetical protein
MGQPAPNNPLSVSATTPFLQDLLGGSLLAEKSLDTPQLLLKPIDATLGIKGLPQSATGQTSLYTGRNAPAFLGRHLTGFANGSLRILIEESGIFKQTLAAGGTPTHANLYSPGYFEAIEQRRIRYSVGTLVGLTAGVPFRMPEDYHRGEAIFWDITGQHMQERGVDAPAITADEAGQRLAQIGAQNSVTLFECYLPDFAGHSQNYDLAVEVLQLVDEFLQSVVKSLPSDVTLIISSDHGNIEDLSTKSHTLNPVPLLVVGQDAAAFRPVEDIMGITPKIIELLSVQN